MKSKRKLFAILLILVVVAVVSSCQKKTCPAYSQVVTNSTEVAKA